MGFARWSSVTGLLAAAVSLGMPLPEARAELTLTPTADAALPALPPKAASGAASGAASDAARSSWLDRRSVYGQGWFPEPVYGDETDAEREIRVDWFHGEKSNRQVDGIKQEVEWNFGMLTIEAEFQWESERESGGEGPFEHEGVHGYGPAELALRHPIVQYVSSNGFFDYTLVGKFGVGIPTRTNIPESENFIAAPALLQALRLGEHWSLQTTTGVEYKFGPRSQEGGAHELKYSLALGYMLEHSELPLPGVVRTIPLLELVGSTQVGGVSSMPNALYGVAGVRWNLESIGAMQPRLGFGWVLPIDSGAREELNWGFVTSLVLEF